MKLQALDPGSGQMKLKVPPKVNASLSGIQIGDTGKVYPLQLKWKNDLGESVKSAVAGQSGRVYVVLRNEDVALALDADGKTDGEFKASDPYSVGEGKEKVYVASKDHKLHAYDFSGHQIWEKEWQRDSSRSYYYYGSASPSSPVEDASGNVWLNDEKTLYRFSPDGQAVAGVKTDGYKSDQPVLADKKGFVYTKNDGHFRAASDLTLDCIEGNPDHIFVAQDKLYSIIDHKMFRLDFDEVVKTTSPYTQEEKTTRGTKKEVLHWNEDKKALKPAVGRDGTIHLVLKNNSAKNGLYVAVSPNGHVKYRRDLDFNVDDKDPVVTPNGTVYMIKQKYEKSRWTYSLYAIDKGFNQHCVDLPQEPEGIFNGKGEKVEVVLKNGTVLCYEAKSLQEIIKERREKARDKETIQDLGSAWMSK